MKFLLLVMTFLLAAICVSASLVSFDLPSIDLNDSNFSSGTGIIVSTGNVTLISFDTVFGDNRYYPRYTNPAGYLANFTTPYQNEAAGWTNSTNWIYTDVGVNNVVIGQTFYPTNSLWFPDLGFHAGQFLAYFQSLHRFEFSTVVEAPAYLQNGVSLLNVSALASYLNLSDDFLNDSGSFYPRDANPNGYYNSSTLPGDVYDSSAAGWTNNSTTTNTALEADVGGNLSAYMLLQNESLHAYGGFQRTTTTITLSGANVWANITNSSHDLWTALEFTGIAMVNDSMVFARSGDYVGALTVSISGLNGKDFFIRVFDTNSSLQAGFSIGATTTGAGNYIPVSLPVYIHAVAGHFYALQIENIGDSASPTVRSAVFEVHYLHDYH